MTRQPISIRGCRVHNLRDVDVDIPRGELVVICGLSGSGKTSLALDTLYAEGQRSYIESFSAYTRQYLNQLDKPDCDSISGIPPAIAVTRASAVKTNRSTVATSTEIAEHLRLLFARASELVCYQCGQPVVIDSPQSVAAQLSDPAANVQRAIVGFELWLPNRKAASEILLGLQQEGFVRLILKGETFQLSDEDRSKMAKRIGSKGVTATVVVDRLSSSSEMSRWTESLETAMTEGNGRAVVLFQSDKENRFVGFPTQSIDGREMLKRVASDRHRCDHCDIEYPDPVPRAFNFNHPMGACPECEGFGDVIGIDMDRIVPDKSKSIRAGAIAPWNAPSYQHELEELLELADDYDLPVDVPFSNLKKKHLKLIHEGVRERKFGGLNGFFAWLDRKKYKMHIRVFASRYRSYRTCPACDGDRLKPESLAYKVGGRNVSEMLAMRCDELDPFLRDWLGADAEKISPSGATADLETVSEKLVGYQTQAELLIADQQRRHTIASEPVRQIRDRLRYLDQVGLGYLQLNRTLRTLSGGETQRIALTLALGSTLVGMLYVLDEPTAGLHPTDVEQLVNAITQLRDRGNTVVAVEHNDTLIQLADRVIEIGPGAGVGGGVVTFEGSPKQLVKSKDSLTGRYLGKNRKRSIQVDLTDGRTPTSSLKLTGASGHNLRDLEVEVPLGCLTVVTGRSGSGKSSLIHDTLFGAVSMRLAERRGEVPSADIVARTLPFQSLRGETAVDDCLLVDQSPISRSPRSCPVTFAKAFDPIRQAFAETVDAKIRNFKPGHFSFNSSAGQCPACEGAGVQTIDMQFLADVSMRCGECRGRRYREEVLQVRYRDRTIADVLEMTVREASEFFREMPKVQNKLKRLIDVGLDYVALGQPATTLSSGEAQRLKLAAFLAGSSKRRTLFLMDEPTTGLHFDDIQRLLKCFDALIDEGHSLVVIEHHPMLMAAADQIIEVGPGAAEEGGQIVASGTRDEVASVNDSLTGKILRQML